MSRRNLRSKLNAAAVVVGLAVWLGNTGAAFALGGSGSADFGGGDGGGGGGGFGGSGSGGGGAGHVPAGVWIVIACAVVVVLFGGGVYAWLRILPRRWRVHRRERRVRAAAAIAAQDDPAFAMDQVLAEAGVLWLDIQAAWDARDRSRLRRLVGPELWAEWDRRLRDFDRKGWRNRVKPLGRPRVEYVGLHHGGEPDGDRVVVAVEARVQDYVQGPGGERIPRQGSSSLTIDTFQYWTLAKQDRRRDPEERWILVSVEDAAEGKHELTDALVAAPEYALGKMRDEALVERAVAESVPPGTNIAELADLEFDGDARQAANDLSLADGRFAPGILEIAARRAVHAWAQALDGDRRDLERIADREVIGELLHPGDPSAKTRVVVRGPHVRKMRIVSLDPKSDPPSMRLEIELEGRRYVEDRDTRAMLSGSRTRRARFTERWTLGISEEADQPWRIVSIAAPARARA